jgi:hypothetical protein
MIKNRFACPGQYCHVVLEEGTLAAPRTLGVTKKSLLLDRYENPLPCAEDPLGLETRKFLSLDLLMQKTPNLRPSNFYDFCKVCKNCELAYSIIDFNRTKLLKPIEVPKMQKGMISCKSSFQTRLSMSHLKLSKSVLKLKKRMDHRKTVEYENMKNILMPVGHTRMSKIAEELLKSMIPEGYRKDNSEKQEKVRSRGSEEQDKGICELAMSVLRKRIHKSVHVLKKGKINSKTFPKMFVEEAC